MDFFMTRQEKGDSLMQPAFQEKVGSVLPDKSTNTSRVCYYIRSK
jgi:hypothetical protein